MKRREFVLRRLSWGKPLCGHLDSCHDDMEHQDNPEEVVYPTCFINTTVKCCVLSTTGKTSLECGLQIMTQPRQLNLYFQNGPNISSEWCPYWNRHTWASPSHILSSSWSLEGTMKVSKTHHATPCSVPPHPH